MSLHVMEIMHKIQINRSGYCEACSSRTVVDDQSKGFQKSLYLLKYDQWSEMKW